MVALSSPGPGMERLYTSISSWIASAAVMCSARTISWIWKRTVSRFSKTRLTLSPTGTRRRFLTSMT